MGVGPANSNNHPMGGFFSLVIDIYSQGGLLIIYIDWIIRNGITSIIFDRAT